jgi:branched-chain amino acid transport system ATP-binding protein
MLKVNKIDVFYDALQVIWGVSLEVNEREIACIVGPNAAGKSTLLNTISGLLHPKSGSISFLGKRIDHLSPDKIVELGISLVPEGRRLFSEMTVLENLELGAYSKEARLKKDETLEWVFQLFPILKERKNQLARTLSGGESQMLAIARGLMSKPKLLMLDEPSLGLAPQLVLKLFDVIAEIKKGLTILLVEQNAYEALKLADTAYLLENGKIKLRGTGKELMDDDYLKKAYLALE